MEAYSIVHTEKTDLNFIYHMFDEAIIYQKRKGYPFWEAYDKDILDSDIENKLQYKIVIDDQIACIFSICYSDPIVWRERDKGDAIYLHRIVVNPVFKGQKHVGKILEWAKEHAKERKLLFLRMDTWADNSNIIDYYKSFGFYIVDYYTTPDTEELPVQQRGNNVILLEIKV